MLLNNAKSNKLMCFDIFWSLSWQQHHSAGTVIQLGAMYSSGFN